MAIYADIILPLAIDNLYTYLIPSSLEKDVEIGKRVIVPLGKSRTYVGIIAKIHQEKPNFNIKPIYSILDDSPIITQTQLELWQWIADYYMSPLGEVMNAALPLGLKSLDSYKPKTQICISLAPKYKDKEMLLSAAKTMFRALKQKKALEDFLSLSGWDYLINNSLKKEIKTVTKEDFLNFSSCLSSQLKALIDKGILETYSQEVGRLDFGGELNLKKEKKLSPIQKNAFKEILKTFKHKDVVLLHGVTSSGKTEIYIHLIKEALKKGEQVLYLLPEIALSVQLRQRLQTVFGDHLGIYHSKCSEAQKVEIWKKQLSQNPYNVIMGARSALFVPLKKLGLIIVDEEHDSSFKQQDPTPRYHGRDTSIMLARISGAKTLLGTATPSVESYYNALKEKYGYVKISERYGKILLPSIVLVDVKDLQKRKMMKKAFSPTLISAINNALASNEQVILFQNRRGFSLVIECRDCGWTPKCENCDVSLTFHKSLNKLSCHYCGKTYATPRICPKCGSEHLQGYGYGTEKIEDIIEELFPTARVARMDLDTTKKRKSYENIINDFYFHKTDILVGTQMISKGLDFDNVSVVGVLDADSMLNIPDFRAFEHAFMMITQVSGRSGRKNKQGLVILQTKNPDLPVITQIVENDYKNFYKDLFQERELFQYPPICRLIYIYI